MTKEQCLSNHGEEIHYTGKHQCSKAIGNAKHGKKTRTAFICLLNTDYTKTTGLIRITPRISIWQANAPYYNKKNWRCEK